MFADLLDRVVDRTVQGGDALLRACGRASREPERAGFLVASGAHLGATALGAVRLRTATKPLLMPLLVGSVLRSQRSYARAWPPPPRAMFCCSPVTPGPCRVGRRPSR